jgi:hypothetical protein
MGTGGRSAYMQVIPGSQGGIAVNQPRFSQQVLLAGAIARLKSEAKSWLGFAVCEGWLVISEVWVAWGNMGVSCEPPSLHCNVHYCTVTSLEIHSSSPLHESRRSPRRLHPSLPEQRLLTSTPRPFKRDQTLLISLNHSGRTALVTARASCYESCSVRAGFPAMTRANRHPPCLLQTWHSRHPSHHLQHRSLQLGRRVR